MFKVPKLKSFSAKIKVQADKSISHRSIILASLAKGTSEIRNILRADDVLNTVAIFRNLGVHISDHKGILTVKGKGLFGLSEPESVLDTGNSGTGIRLITGVLASQTFTSFITGDASIVQRPMSRIIKPLTLMGADITGKADNTKAPLCIRGLGTGTLKGITYDMPVTSAQVKSAILLAGLSAKGRTIVNETVPTRDHTERMMQSFGINLISSNGKIILDQKRNNFNAHDTTIPGDISSANFFIILSLLSPKSRLTLSDIGLNPSRTGILKVFEQCNARVHIMNRRVINFEERGDIHCEFTPDLKPFKISGTLAVNVIDEIPILSILASQINGVSEFRDLGELRFKESDRIRSIVTYLRAMGVKVVEFKEGFSIKGKTDLKGTAITSFDDHRIVMSFYIAGLLAKGITTIDKRDSVNTSFPHFFKLMEDLHG